MPTKPKVPGQTPKTSRDPIPIFETKGEYIEEIKTRRDKCTQANQGRYRELLKQCRLAKDAGECRQLVDAERAQRSQKRKEQREKRGIRKNKGELKQSKAMRNSLTPKSSHATSSLVSINQQRPSIGLTATSNSGPVKPSAKLTPGTGAITRASNSTHKTLGATKTTSTMRSPDLNFSRNKATADHVGSDSKSSVTEIHKVREKTPSKQSQPSKSSTDGKINTLTISSPRPQYGELRQEQEKQRGQRNMDVHSDARELLWDELNPPDNPLFMSEFGMNYEFEESIGYYDKYRH